MRHALGANDAMRDRSTTIDLILAFAATSVITLAFWPKTTPRQIVRCNTAQHGWKTYSIAVDDPTLAELKKKVYQWSTPEMDPRYATSKWQKETAEFYQSGQPCDEENSSDCDGSEQEADAPTTATLSDTVATASYETTLDQNRDAVQPAAYYATSSDLTGGQEATSPSDNHYWATVKASAEASIQSVESRSTDVPIVFDRIVLLGWPQLAFHCAFLFGIAAACGYMHWLRYTPIRTRTSLSHQPFSVLARIGTFGGCITFSMISAVAVWV
jgi:hypothetical protein